MCDFRRLGATYGKDEEDFLRRTFYAIKNTLDAFVRIRFCGGECPVKGDDVVGINTDRLDLAIVS